MVDKHALGYEEHRETYDEAAVYLLTLEIRGELAECEEGLRVQLKHIGNTRAKGHGLQFQRQAILPWLQVSFIESSQAYPSEVDVLYAVAHGFNPDVFTCHQIAHMDASRVSVDEV